VLPVGADVVGCTKFAGAGGGADDDDRDSSDGHGPHNSGGGEAEVSLAVRDSGPAGRDPAVGFAADTGVVATVEGLAAVVAGPTCATTVVVPLLAEAAAVGFEDGEEDDEAFAETGPVDAAGAVVFETGVDALGAAVVVAPFADVGAGEDPSSTYVGAVTLAVNASGAKIRPVSSDSLAPYPEALLFLKG